MSGDPIGSTSTADPVWPSDGILLLPLLISPDSCLPPEDMPLLPGMTLTPASGRMRATFDELSKMGSGRFPFRPTFFLLLETASYLDGLETRITGKLLEAVREGRSEDGFVDPGALGRMVLIALLLTRRLRTGISGWGSLKVSSNGPVLRGMSFGFTELTAPRSVAGNPTDTPDPLKAREHVRQLIFRLEPYFRPFTWRTDRMATALRYYWIALHTTYAEQSFMTMMSALEALLATSKWGHNKTVKRNAMKLFQDDSSAAPHLALIDKLYETRNQLAHGNPSTVFGRITLADTFIHAHRGHVAQGHAKAIAALVPLVISRVLLDDKLMAALRTPGTEDEDAKALSAAYGHDPDENAASSNPQVGD